jgi:molybdopterin-guanine dinucleotide biosynthesis protein B
MAPAIPAISIVGASGSGKTTLLEKLVRELKRRGYRIAVIKHHPHPGLDADVPEKDTWRLSRSGADHVVLAAPDQVMHRRRLERELSLEQVVAGIRDVDLILTEGYRGENAPKIQVSRGTELLEPVCDPAQLVAIVADRRFDVDVPQFDLDDAAGLADLIAGLAPSWKETPK